MATKGYNSYRGRMSGGKIVLIVVLALVLVGAVAYLALQNYVVYDEAGNATIDLPFFHRKDDRGEKTDDSTVDGTGDRDDIVDTVVPEHPHVKVAALHGTRLPDDCLWWGADYIMNTLAPEDLVLALKRTTGGITYATDVETPQGVVVETGRPIECLHTLLSSGRYTVGHIVCFRDSAYARRVPETALVREDGQLWYDAEGQAWLDPTDPQVLQYITALVKRHRRHKLRHRRHRASPPTSAASAVPSWKMASAPTAPPPRTVPRPTAHRLRNKSGKKRSTRPGASFLFSLRSHSFRFAAPLPS